MRNLWLLLLFLLAPHAALAQLPGPAPQLRRPGIEAENRRCEGCHSDIAEEWRQSFHRQSYTDPAYQRALRIEPRAFCRGCHAPEADPERAAVGWPHEAGVACVTCHLLGDRIVTGTSNAARGAGPHAVRRDPRLSHDGACQRCHEFGFPDGHARTRRELMQSTLSEHALFPDSDRPCIACHMPRVGLGGGHRSHRFLGGHDPELVRRSLEVAAEYAAGHVVRLRLSPNEVGHAVPTGDLLRRLAVEVRCAGPPGQPGFSALRYLTRHFGAEAQVPGTFVMVTRRDDRIQAPTVLDFPLPAGLCAEPPRFRVTYERVLLQGGFRRRADTHDSAVIDGWILIAEGSVALR